VSNQNGWGKIELTDAQNVVKKIEAVESDAEDLRDNQHVEVRELVEHMEQEHHDFER